ncbi:glycosyl transferase family 2 [Neosynechococcus sphagnicola sy1]|uniref:Glycosyl transferase family 2 n=2 Tax=Neosynechococcus TaxID=1501143 RepID=A0A098TNR1_9CYAN|nr:glycosyl transferase family 2 [Neosynechococcus sphagnicola sy1]
MGIKLPLRVGLVGTGYAAKLRADALQSDPRWQLLAVVGYTPTKTQEFAKIYQAEVLSSWVELVHRPDLDLVIIATINRDHGAIAQAALLAGKHVVVEYPLALNFREAEKLVTLATTQKRLLHVEHIELLGGVHQALQAALPQVGSAFYARYATITPQHPAPQRWTYQPDLFGFPLVGALSRVHRLTDVFGAVETVTAQARLWPGDEPYYASCICNAQLRFQSGLLAEVSYGKGEHFGSGERTLTVHGDQGSLIFAGDEGRLMQGDSSQPLTVGSRRGLFAKDTQMVLAHLLEGEPLYVAPAASLYALQVADAARRSVETGQRISLENSPTPGVSPVL